MVIQNIMQSVYDYNLTPKQNEVVLVELKFSRFAVIPYLLLILIGIPLLVIFLIGLIPITVGLFYLVKTLDHADHDKYTITSKRIHTLIANDHRNVALEMDIPNIINVSIEQGVIGGLFNIGTIACIGTTSYLSFGPVKRPADVKQMIDLLRDGSYEYD